MLTLYVSSRAPSNGGPKGEGAVSHLASQLGPAVTGVSGPGEVFLLVESLLDPWFPNVLVSELFYTQKLLKTSKGFCLCRLYHINTYLIRDKNGKI